MSAPARPGSARYWRFAAVLALIGGGGAALWVDPALLDRKAVHWPLIGLFVLLWLVPHFQARRAETAAARARNPDWHEPDPKASRSLLDTVIGVLTGLVLGAVALSVPGMFELLNSGPEAVDKAFDFMADFNILSVVVLSVLGVSAFWFGIGILRRSIRASRLVGGIVIGVALWIPLHNSFEIALAKLGLKLPGLHLQQIGKQAVVQG